MNEYIKNDKRKLIFFLKLGWNGWLKRKRQKNATPFISFLFVNCKVVIWVNNVSEITIILVLS